MRPDEKPGAVWDELPAALRDRIKKNTGPVLRAVSHGEGLSTSVRLILHTADGDVFVKGTGPDSTDHQRNRLALGAAMAPYVTAVSPPLLWQVQADGWHVTGWPALPGRPWADQKPGSDDIPKMVSLLTALAEIPAPAVLTRTSRDEWEAYADDSGVFDGDGIVHRDPNPTNFVVNGGQAWLVDFGWAARGPAWLTAANLVLSMMEAGWEPGDAEKALTGIPAWDKAPSDAVTAFSAANARMWDQAVERADTKVRRFRADVANRWAEHRRSSLPSTRHP